MGERRTGEDGDGDGDKRDNSTMVNSVFRFLFSMRYFHIYALSGDVCPSNENILATQQAGRSMVFVNVFETLHTVTHTPFLPPLPIPQSSTPTPSLRPSFPPQSTLFPPPLPPPPKPLPHPLPKKSHSNSIPIPQISRSPTYTNGASKHPLLLTHSLTHKNKGGR